MLVGVESFNSKALEIALNIERYALDTVQCGDAGSNSSHCRVVWREYSNTSMRHVLD